MLVPARLRCSGVLATGWRVLLARDGVTLSGDGSRVAITMGRTTWNVRVDTRADHTTCDLALVTDEAVRGHLEAAFLASGAILEDWTLITTPLRVLYRLDDDAWPGVVGAWVREGLRTSETLTSWCPGGEAFPEGEIRLGPARIAYATGPALDPQSGRPARFLDLSPCVPLLDNTSIRDLLQQCDRLLVAAGAVPIYRLGSPISPDAA